MKSPHLALALATWAFAAALPAQTLVLENFNAGTATGSARPGTSWVGNITQNAGTITLGGTARDDNGWGATGQAINATGMSFLAITAQRDAGHVGSAFAIQFEDRNLNTQVFSVSTSLFASGALTQVQIAIGSWAGGFDATQITGWSIGGGSVGVADYRMTFDHLALTAAPTPGVPVAPVVTGDFGARTRAPGETISFAVSATGTGPLAYQWFKNTSTPIPNNPTAATATLTLTNLTATDAGSYTCAVTNAAGTRISGVFSLTVTATPATIALGNLAPAYTGTPRAVTAITAPPGLAVAVSYNGSVTAPVDAGRYAVVATVNDPRYTGQAVGTLVIAKAVQSIAMAALPATLRAGMPFPVNATATSGGPVVFAVLHGNAAISGNVVTPGDSSSITLRATQAGDSNHLAATIDFAFATSRQNQSIDFASIPAPAAGLAPIGLSATASSGLPVLFSVVSGPATLDGSTLTATGTGTVIVRALQGGNDVFNAAPSVDRSVSVTAPPPPPSAPIIAQGPTERSVAAGAPFTLAVEAGGSGGLAYQWFKDGNALAGATGAAFSIARAAAADAGSYRVDVSNPAGTTRSASVAVVVAESRIGADQRLVNFSTRAHAGSGDDVVIAGFAITGEASKPVLIRAIGPALGGFGVTGAVAAPRLQLFRGATVIASNTGWAAGESAAAIAAAATRVGAFALESGSADSALLATLAPGNYTAVISASDARAGVGLVEVYDLSDATLGERISNLSVRTFSGTEADTLIVGVVVAGSAPRRLLVRAIGPSLAQFGVTGVLARPQLTLFAGSTEIARNTGWSTSIDAASITQAAAQVGAFPLAAGSLDAAIVTAVSPGSYTVQVSGIGATSGVALVEVYELP